MRLSFIPAQLIKIEMATRADLPQFILGGVYLIPGTSAGRVRLWKVNLADYSDGGEITFDNDAGKDDSVAFSILPNGDVLVAISEAAGLAGAGITTAPSIYPIPGVFPAQPEPVDLPARKQANAATKMAGAALAGVAAVSERVEALEG